MVKLSRHLRQVCLGLIIRSFQSHVGLLCLIL